MNPNQDMERKSITVMVMIATAVVASAIQIASWDKYAVDVMPILIKDLIGATSPQDWEAKAKMCFELKKWDCVESEYIRAAQHDQALIPRLGHYQMRRLKFDQAARNFAVYFKKGGQDLDAAAAYAVALAETNQFDEASKYFNQVLQARPDSEQIPIIMSFVKMLMKNEKYQDAQRLIEDVRHKNPAGSQFMDSEYKQIKKILTASR